MSSMILSLVDSIIQKLNTPKIWAFINERNEITSYKRPKDGKGLTSIPFNEMNDYENELIERLHNLWKKYQ